QRDVWFAFTAVDTILDYRITVTGVFDSTLNIASMVNPQIAVYRGDCVFDGLELLECATSDNGETEVYLELSGLTPGIPYYLRINDWSPSGTPNEGAFKLCIEKKPPVTTIDQGSSTLCSGTLCDSGGPNGDYGNDENFTFTICPTAPHNCINFNLQYYNLDVGSDQILFYDGPNANSPLLGSLTSGFTSQGGVCYSVSASSGCLTIVFKSDANAVFEGFCGTWECTAEECQPSAVIDVQTDATPEEMVQSVVSGQTNVTITNIDCPDGAMGIFEAPDNSDLGLKKGLILSSGSAPGAAQPGSAFSSFANPPSINDGDSDLDYFSGVQSSEDACIVEMEVFAATDELTFEYVFGSEEYPEFVNLGYNDIFAFLVSGPGIVGDPNIANQQNVATLPDGTFVEVNSVNYASNWQYYRYNQLNGQSVVYDGLTSDSLGVKKSLTARVATIPCNTYKLKLAIADRGDAIYDSGVFISEIKGGSPNLGVNYFSGIDYLVEECTNIADEITVSLDNPVPTITTFGVEVTGTATQGVDYTLNIPTTLTFATGTEVFNFPIQAITDNLPEGVETIIIRLTRDFGCGVVTLAELTVNLHDNLQVDIFKDEIDTAFVCQGSCIQLKSIGAQNYFWQPPGLMSDPNISNPIACPDTSTWVSVLGTLGICSDMDSIYLLLVNPEVQIQPDTNQLAVCPGDTVSLFAQNNVGNSNLQWNGFIFPPLVDPSNPSQVFVPDPAFGSFFLQVQVELGGCTAFDDILIGIDNLQMPVVANDTLICQNYPVDLGEEPPFNNGTTYSWTPDYNLDPGADAAGPIATPDQTTTYTLIATGPFGQCKDTAEVTIEVVPADVEILTGDTAFICIGDTVALISTSTTNGVGQTWYPQVFMNQIEPGLVEVSPPVSTWYFTKLVVGACTIVDSVLVYVDSLPGLEIVPEPNKPSYCQGEEVKLISPTYEPANFPGIDLEWINPVPGSLTPDSFLNLVFIALEDHTYLRRVTVHGCTRIDSIFIDVVPVASMQVIPAIDTICPGESVQFSIDAEPGITDFSWSPSNGLSCTDCENPIATPPGTTTYNVEGEFEGCPVGASATIIVSSPPQYAFPNPFACPGTNVTLNLQPDPNATYSWTSSDNSVTSNEAAPVATPFVTT
ncbi:MAG: choice-of-anchor L domain-containing protein, partial [Bacteroidota bacterium]